MLTRLLKSVGPADALVVMRLGHGEVARAVVEVRGRLNHVAIPLVPIGGRDTPRLANNTCTQQQTRRQACGFTDQVVFFQYLSLVSPGGAEAEKGARELCGASGNGHLRIHPQVD